MKRKDIMGVLKNALSDKEITYRQFEDYNDRRNSERHRAKPGEHKKLKKGTYYLEIGYVSGLDVQVKIIKNIIVQSVFSESEENQKYDYVILELCIADFKESDGEEKEALVSEHDIEIKSPPIG